MGFSLDDFKDVFFEECNENLQLLESTLVSINYENVDKEDLNVLFRVIHSIKGGSATFDMKAIADISHVTETLLDELREGKMPFEKVHSDLLLNFKDLITSLLDMHSRDEEVSEDLIKELYAVIEKHLDTPHVKKEKEDLDISDDIFTGKNEPADTAAVSDAPSDDTAQDTSATASSNFSIKFVPQKNFFLTGNDPLTYINELIKIGATIETNYSNIPKFLDLNTDNSFLSWEIEILGDCTKLDLDNVFEWIVDDCTCLEIKENNKPKLPEQQEQVKDSPLESSEEVKPISDSSSEPADKADEPEVSEKQDKTAEQSDTKDDNKKPPAKAKAESDKAKPKEAPSSIRVNTDKIDRLVNLIGEMVITQSMLKQAIISSKSSDAPKTEQNESMLTGLALLEKNVRELQDGIMNIRMVPIGLIFSKIPRMVYDLEKKLDKKVTLKLIGEQTELDKSIIEKLSDPITHLIRNSIGHGIEVPEERLKAGKSESGLLTVKAYHQSGKITIEIRDDGKGIDYNRIKQKSIEKGILTDSESLTKKEILECIFHPGFSTMDKVTEVSGRGVGMDVVRQNISSLGGTIDINSWEGKGTTMTIRLPLTLAIMDGQLVQSGSDIFIVPIACMLESICIENSRVSSVGLHAKYYLLREKNVPIINLKQVFRSKIKDEEHDDEKDGLLIIVEDRNNVVAIMVDKILEQQQIVLKSLEDNYQNVVGISGATILGDGRVALIIDVNGLFEKHCRELEAIGETISSVS